MRFMVDQLPRSILSRVFPLARACLVVARQPRAQIPCLSNVELSRRIPKNIHEIYVVAYRWILNVPTKKPQRPRRVSGAEMAAQVGVEPTTK